MQFLSIDSASTLSQLSSRVGQRNVDSILQANGLTRCPNIKQSFAGAVSDAVSTTGKISNQRMTSLLNTTTSDSDVFEDVALLDGDGWKVFSTMSTFKDRLRIPETVTLPDAVDITGNGEPIKRDVYDAAISQLSQHGVVDPSIFNEYSSRRGTQIVDTSAISNALQWFHLPWGMISLYSSISNSSVDFPVYPAGIEQSISATYDTMPDMLYQYEPWQLYKSSGPRTQSFTFDMHRDMWTGDHRDGKCNELIRFCEANCYPDYRGAAVYTSTVTLYIAGKPLISGIMTDVKTDWDGDGPIGLDNYFLHVKLTITITEVSKEALNYSTVAKKGLIG